ncbi:hypothetical protein LCI18_013868 [Fusarium solani-melongenae]|uniref:Uncharacterized protein n=1 Tax=Fusarium solani subsp. cucurbitae TaxID=2747967 RepID=A0ACD3ZSA1_FUSSC|nr:hypothetical protein LCI18_013868 [Fusarium solani-melongenae]
MTYGAYNAEKGCSAKTTSPQKAEPIQRPQAPQGKRGPSHDPEKASALRYGAMGGSDTVNSASAGQGADLEFPEGGLQAWLVVFGSFCAMLSVFGLINTAAVFESYFSKNQLRDYSASEIGWIFSLYVFIVFFVGIQVGPIFDKYGPRVPVATGGLLITGSLLALSACEGYYQIILAYSVMGGLGGALINSPAYSSIAHFFDARRGFATGIATAGGSVGGIVFPFMLQKLLPTIGFAWTARILGLIVLGLAVPSMLLLRSRLPPQDKVTSVWPDLTVFQDLKFALAALGIFFMEWGLFVPLTYIVSYAGRFSGDAMHSYTLLSILNASSALGRFIPGLLADKIGRFNVILITIVMCIVTILGLWVPAGDSQAMLTAFAVLFGFASGSNLGLVPVCLGQLCDPRDYGRFISTALMVASFGTLSSLPIAGAILEAGNQSDGGWKALIAFAGLSYALALGCYLATRVLAVGWSVKKTF